MKDCLLIILLGTQFVNLNAQKLDSILPIEFITPREIQPKWIYGTNNQLIQDITSKIKYPNEQCIEGITVLQFIVDTSGQVVNPIIKRSVS